MGWRIFSETNSDLSASSTTILNSTVSGNMADAGGGVTNYNGLTRVLHSTVTANRASSAAALVLGDGGTRTDVEGSIVAGNTTDGITPNDVANNQTATRYRSLGYNVVGKAGANVDFTLEFDQPATRRASSTRLCSSSGRWPTTAAPPTRTRSSPGARPSTRVTRRST